MDLFGVKKHHGRSLWILVLLLLFSATTWAQSGSVTGRVSDEKGELLIGVSVQEKVLEMVLLQMSMASIILN
nr:hypothetical protein [Bacteroides reticulotermitis]